MLLVAMAPERGGSPTLDAALLDGGRLLVLVRAVVARLLGERVDHPDVEDCASEVMRRAMEDRGRLREGEPVRPWVVGIAKHVAIDARRARQRVRARQGSDASADAVPDPALAPDERVMLAQQAKRVDAALATLPAQTRDALRLFHVEGLSYDQIASRLGVPIGTVATWVARGRRALADRLRDDDRTVAERRRSWASGASRRPEGANE